MSHDFARDEVNGHIKLLSSPLSRIHNLLLYGTLAAATTTAIYFLSQVYWPSVFSRPLMNVVGEIIAYAFFAACECIPFGVLAGLLSYAKKLPAFQLLSFFLVVGVAAYSFITVRLSSVNSGGWEFVIVPFLLLPLELVLFVICYFVSRLRP